MINGNCLLNAIISGNNNIANNKSMVDKLNIFPIPDGDTGTNMSMTMAEAAEKLKNTDPTLPIGEIANIAASALLRGARGNSGTILSLLFRGFAKGLTGIENATGLDLIDALSLGVSAAYNAVMNPAEGTMLTVSRVAYERGKIAVNKSNDAVYVWEEVCNGAKEALATTPELLPVLKKAGVVDAGGKGVCLIFEGMLSVFKNGEIIKSNEENETKSIQVFEGEFSDVIKQFDEEINFTYCTEFIVGRDKDILTSPLNLRSYLESIGDCVVVVDDEEIIKVHVHTEDPGLAIQEALNYGELLKVKVDNMREQNRKIKNQAQKKDDNIKLEFVEPIEEIGFVAVAAGEGLKELFKDLGCSNVVSGGQTMNPSVQHILEAVLATPAKNVFVLPNNKNIILAAEQAIPLATDRQIIVLPTRTIPQGLSAMLAFNPELNISDNLSLMNNAFTKVRSGQITFAARNSEYGGFKIKQDDILAFIDGKLMFKAKDPVKAVVKLVHYMVDKTTEFITIMYGNSITSNQADLVAEGIKSKIGSNIDVTLINGQQPLDYFVVSVE